jgi:hypothetical protein
LVRVYGKDRTYGEVRERPYGNLGTRKEMERSGEGQIKDQGRRNTKRCGVNIRNEEEEEVQ